MIRVKTQSAQFRLVVAAPKAQIQKYKIEEPTIKMLIYKYEALIPWEQIQSKEDLNIYVKTHLLQNIANKIDPQAENNNYLKDIDVEEMFQAAPNDPQIAAAWQIFQRDPDGARTTLLRTINENKRQSFMQWWNYMNETYQEHPSFAFTVLKPIVDMSDETTRDGTMPLNAEAVAAMFDACQNGNVQFNVLKTYKKETERLDRESGKMINTGEDGTGWLNIPSIFHDEPNFTKNCDKLKRFSTGLGWCTASGQAEPYLRQGDFWLYLENGAAKVAIRMLGENRIAEIRGKDNKVPYDYSQQVINFVESQPIDKNSTFYEEFQKIIKLNTDIKSDPNVKAQVINNIKRDPFEFNKLLKENRTPDMVAIAEPGFVKYLENNASRYMEIPLDIRAMPNVRQAFLQGIAKAVETNIQYTNFINTIPESERKTPEVQEQIKIGMGRRFGKKAPSKREYNELPEQFRNDPTVLSAIIPGVVARVSKEPGYFNDMPDEFKAFPALREAAEKEFMRVLPSFIAKDPTKTAYDKIPEAIRNTPQIKTEFLKAAPEFLNKMKEVHFFAALPDFVKEDPSFRSTAISFLAPLMSIPRNIQYVPESLRNDPAIQRPYQANLIRYIQDFPQFVMDFPPDVQKRPDFFRAFITGLTRYFQTEPELYNKLSPELQNNPEVQNAYTVARASSIAHSPSSFWSVPRAMQRNQQFQDIAADGVVKQLMRNPASYRYLHPIMRNHPRVRRFFTEKTQTQPSLLPQGQRPVAPGAIENMPANRPARNGPPPNRRIPGAPRRQIPGAPRRPIEQDPNIAKTWYNGLKKPPQKEL